MKKLAFSVAVVLAMSGFAASAVAADDWAGPYAGLQAGYIGGDADVSSWHVPPEEGHEFSLNGFDVDGVAGGIFGGYIWRAGNDFLLGIELEANLASADETITIDEGEVDYWGATVKQEWDTSLRLIAGKEMGSYMPYLTGGIAMAGVNVQGFTSWDYQDNNDATLTGWTVGAGLEKKINENFHARIQYRYSGYGDETWTIAEPNDVNRGKIEYSAHMLTVGFSYCF
jgi:outer membrane immunogenic protein